MNDNLAIVEKKRSSKPKKIKIDGIPDIRFIIYVVLLLIFGAIMSYSASMVYAEKLYGSSTYFFVRYVVFALFSIILTIPFVLFATAKFWAKFGIYAYIVSIVLLVLVPIIGKDGGGAKRWIDLKVITIQPSEIAKMAIVIMLAYFLSKNEEKILTKKNHNGDFIYGVLIPFLIFGSVCILIALEKHISGLMIVGMIGLFMMYMGGTRMKWLLLIVGIILAAFFLLLLVSDYAQERVNTWLHIEEVDPLGPAWQTLQGLYTIGSGGFFGVGFLNSIQKYGYVSQPQNDFIFTIICEELGFVGGFSVILLFVLLLYRGFKTAKNSRDKFSALLVYGLVFKTALQVILNIAVVTNSMPNTGISLPFFSSGGTSLSLQIFEMGIILSCSKYSMNKKI